MAGGEMKGKLLKVSIIGTLRRVIPLGFEPKTHSLEGCCSNPTELRNQHFRMQN